MKRDLRGHRVTKGTGDLRVPKVREATGAIPDLRDPRGFQVKRVRREIEVTKVRRAQQARKARRGKWAARASKARREIGGSRDSVA